MWDDCNISDSFSLERLQISLARTAISVNANQTYAFDLPKSEALRALRWPTLAWRRRRLKFILFWQLFNGGGPLALRKRLPPTVSNRCGYHLRNQLSVEIPLCSSSSYLSSSLPSTSQLWNTLPATVTSSSSLLKFTHSLDSFFASDFYSFGAGLPP